MALPLYHVSIGYKTPRGNYSWMSFAAIAARSQDEAAQEARRRLDSAATYGRRKVASIHRVTSTLIGFQIPTK